VALVLTLVLLVLVLLVLLVLLLVVLLLVLVVLVMQLRLFLLRRLLPPVRPVPSLPGPQPQPHVHPQLGSPPTLPHRHGLVLFALVLTD